MKITELPESKRREAMDFVAYISRQYGREVAKRAVAAAAHFNREEETFRFISYAILVGNKEFDCGAYDGVVVEISESPYIHL